MRSRYPCLLRRLFFFSYVIFVFVHSLRHLESFYPTVLVYARYIYGMIVHNELRQMKPTTMQLCLRAREGKKVYREAVVE